MIMKTRLTKLALTAHVTSSVGWLGAVGGYLALAVAGLTSWDTHTIRAAYLSMQITAFSVIVPLSCASLLTGLIQSLATTWGLFRYYWVLTKFVMTILSIVVLLIHLPTIREMAVVTAESAISSMDMRQVRMQLVAHAAGALLVLLVTTSLSVYKPWGLTPYGRRNGRRETK